MSGLYIPHQFVMINETIENHVVNRIKNKNIFDAIFGLHSAFAGQRKN